MSLKISGLAFRAIGRRFPAFLWTLVQKEEKNSLKSDDFQDFLENDIFEPEISCEKKKLTFSKVVKIK